MKKYKVKIGYEVEFEINADTKKEAEEYAWFYYDQAMPEPEIEIVEVKNEKI